SGEQRRWTEAGYTRVPYWVYTDPEIYRLEQERIFQGPNWSYVALEAELPNPGDWKTSSIGDKPVIVTRALDNSVHVLATRCAHRGAQVCQAHRGHSKELMCPYHQWTYDLTGKLIGVPFRRGYRNKGGMPEDFRLEDHRMDRLQT